MRFKICLCFLLLLLYSCASFRPHLRTEVELPYDVDDVWRGCIEVIMEDDWAYKEVDRDSGFFIVRRGCLTYLTIFVIESGEGTVVRFLTPSSRCSEWGISFSGEEMINRFVSRLREVLEAWK